MDLLTNTLNLVAQSTAKTDDVDKHTENEGRDINIVFTLKNEEYKNFNFDNINTWYAQHPFIHLVCATSFTRYDGYDRYGPVPCSYYIIIVYKNSSQDNIIVDTWEDEYKLHEKESHFYCHSIMYSQKEFDTYKKKELDNLDDLVLEGSSYTVCFD